MNKEDYLKEFNIEIGKLREEVSDIKKESSFKRTQERNTYLIWKSEHQRQSSM